MTHGQTDATRARLPAWGVVMWNGDRAGSVRREAFPGWGAAPVKQAVRMRRFMAILLFLGSFALVAPPAAAAVTLTLNPSTITTVEGSSVSLSGYAARARLGTVVLLQRRTANGWRTVADRKLRTKRSYVFTVRPKRGHHAYRVLKPRQLGQGRAVSPRSTVTVYWRPTIHVDASHSLWDVDAHVSTGIPNAALVEQRRFHANAPWVTTRTVDTGPDGSFRELHRDGWYEVRYILPGEGLRLRAVSRVVEITPS